MLTTYLAKTLRDLLLNEVCLKCVRYVRPTAEKEKKGAAVVFKKSHGREISDTDRECVEHQDSPEKRFIFRW